MDRKKNVLIVEDEIIIALSEKTELEKVGYCVSISSNGEEAVKIIREKKHPVDIVLMDIDLGKGMDGTEAAREILKTHDIPIIFLSSHSEKDIVQKTDAITSYGYVIKNSGILVLSASIKMAFRLFETNLDLKNKKNEIESLFEELQKAYKKMEAMNEELLSSEKKTMESETMYRELFDNISSGVAIYNVTNDGKDYIFKDLNKSGEIIERESKFDLIGKNVVNMRPGITEFGLLDVFKRVWETGVPEHHPITLYKDSRTNKWYENYVYKIPSGEIVAVFDDVTERMKTIESLKVSEEKYKVLFETIPIGITITDNNGNIIESNHESVKLLDLPRDEITSRSIGGNAWNIIRPDGSAMTDEEFASVRALKENRVVSNVEMGISKSGKETVWINVTSAPIPLDGYGVVVAYNDITEKKNAEKNVRNLLAEKELLLKEVHHRIKNNINTLHSLLLIQANAHNDSNVKEILMNAVSRINSMKVLYDKLYSPGNYSTASVKDFFSHLLKEIMIVFSYIENISFDIQVDDFLLDYSSLSSIGLIVNELITNSFKYAFTDKNSGTIKLRISKESKTIAIEYEDDGIGFPEDFSFEKSAGFGLQLTNMIVNKLNGELKLQNKNGVKFFINFDVSS